MNAACIEAYGGSNLAPIVGGIKGKAPEDRQICHILLSTSLRSMVMITGNQDVCDFTFEVGPIGLEVETSGSRLICSKVCIVQCFVCNNRLVFRSIIYISIGFFCLL